MTPTAPTSKRRRTCTAYLYLSNFCLFCFCFFVLLLVDAPSPFCVFSLVALTVPLCPSPSSTKSLGHSIGEVHRRLYLSNSSSFFFLSFFWPPDDAAVYAVCEDIAVLFSLCFSSRCSKKSRCVPVLLLQRACCTKGDVCRLIYLSNYFLSFFAA